MAGAQPQLERSDATVPLDHLLDRLRSAHPAARLAPESAAALERFAHALLTGCPGVTGEGWAGILGPVAPSGTVAELLGSSRRSLDRARARAEFLALRTADGRWMYPLQQFHWTSEGKVGALERLGEVLRALYASGDESGAARWLATPNRRLQGDTPWERLHEEAQAGAVVDAAEAQARAWSAR